MQDDEIQVSGFLEQEKDEPYLDMDKDHEFIKEMKEAYNEYIKGVIYMVYNELEEYFKHLKSEHEQAEKQWEREEDPIKKLMLATMIMVYENLIKSFARFKEFQNKDQS